MATLASRYDMTTCQGKTGQVVIKPLNFPVFIGMARFAFGTDLPLMLVVFLVASHTLHRRVAVTLEILVTGLAFGLRPLVCVLQAKA